MRANSLNLCSIALGPAFAPLLVVLLMQWVGWRGVFYVFAIPGFIVTFTVLEVHARSPGRSS